MDETLNSNMCYKGKPLYLLRKFTRGYTDWALSNDLFEKSDV